MLICLLSNYSSSKCNRKKSTIIRCNNVIVPSRSHLVYFHLMLINQAILTNWSIIILQVVHMVKIKVMKPSKCWHRKTISCNRGNMDRSRSCSKTKGSAFRSKKVTVASSTSHIQAVYGNRNIIIVWVANLISNKVLKNLASSIVHTIICISSISLVIIVLSANVINPKIGLLKQAKFNNSNNKSQPSYMTHTKDLITSNKYVCKNERLLNSSKPILMRSGMLKAKDKDSLVLKRRH